MSTFSSPEVIVNKSAEALFNELADLNNLKKIMPSEIQDFESTVDTCSFKISGMPKLNLEISEKSPFNKLSLTAKDSQAPFTLNCFITDVYMIHPKTVGAPKLTSTKLKQCQAKLELNIEVNAMMRMMIEKPITQFLNALASKMQNL